MEGSRYRSYWLPLVCLILFESCAKQKLGPLGASVPSLPPVATPVGPATPPSQSPAAQPEKQVAQGKRAGPDVNRLLREPPSMSFSPDGRALKKADAPTADKITVLVDAGSGAIRADEVIIQIALKPLASQFLFKCPDRMRVGAPNDCRFTAKESLNDFLREQLVALGVTASQAATVTVLIHTDLTPLDKNSFDIRAAAASNSSSIEQIWRVVPRSSGDHKLTLRVTPSVRIASASDVKGEPVELVRSVSVEGVNTFFTTYGPATIGSLALALLAAIAWTLWRGARPSVFSSR
jgi:hypothetical protein